MPRTTDPVNEQTTDREPVDRRSDDRHSGQAQVPRPPSRTEVEEISRSQEYLTDDWTGDGGTPQADRQGSRTGN